MPDTPKRQHVEVVLDDGSTYEAHVDQRDYRRFDMTRAAHHWPPATEAPFLLQGFCAASALLRQGDVEGADPVALMHRIVTVNEVGEDDITPTVEDRGGD